jgi:hypothetical protein
MGLVISKGLTLRKGYIGTDDPDAEAYIAAVEAADEAASPGIGALETATKVAIHSFVKGAKADGFWPAIKASCILAGARTRLGALTPLVGTAPTSFNFVDGDYNRKTGLVGNGSTKYLDSNRNDSADPQNSFHLSCYISAASPGSTSVIIMGANDGTNYSQINTGSNNNDMLAFARDNDTGPLVPKRIVGAGAATGLVGASRAASTGWTNRVLLTNYAVTSVSVASANLSVLVFARSQSGTAFGYAASRLAFYSIGESLDLALLDARVTDLINAFGAAIP